MIRPNNIIFALIIGMIFISCEENEDSLSSDIESIKYGTSFGFCGGYCRHEITMTDSKIEFHKSAWGIVDIVPEVSNTENVDSKYLTTLLEKINVASFLALDTIIGCPDCADGGAEWIEISTKGQSHKVTFEYGNEPSEMEGYVSYLRTYMRAFQVESNETVDFNKRTLIDQSGFVKNFVATRGDDQWMIGVKSDDDTTYFFDQYLADAYQIENLKIEFHALFESDSTMINKPAPNDIPIPDFKLRNIRTFDMKTIDD